MAQLPLPPPSPFNQGKGGANYETNARNKLFKKSSSEKVTLHVATTSKYNIDG